MGWTEVVAIVLSAVLGAGGFVGLLFHFLRRAIERRLKASEDEISSRKELQIRRMQIREEWEHAASRAMFWMFEVVKARQSDDEKESSAFQRLEEAYAMLQEIEKKQKELNREILAESGM